MITRLNEYAEIVNLLTRVFAGILVLALYASDQTSSMKMPWSMPILVCPIMGVALYLLSGVNGGSHKLRERYADIDRKLLPLLPDNREKLENIKNKIPKAGNISEYIWKNAGYPVYQNTDIVYYDEAVKGLEAQLSALSKAEKFIFMEYFIVTDSYMWRSILDILKLKASQGVEVRFMYDGMCSLALLPYGYYKELENMGIKSRPFSQIKPVLSSVQNNRAHRKILIVDGKTAFTGGINLADEYIDKLDRFGHWKDTAVMVKGDAVKSFTYMFLKMWNVAGKKDRIEQEEIDNYIINFDKDECLNDFDLKNELIRSNGYVIPYGDSPFSSERIGKRVYIDILNRAQRYVHIMTPYLILDDEMIAALRYCAARGVETTIIMPHIPDKVYAYLLARTYYPELIKHGVNKYEYTPGFIHAKQCVCDGEAATCGTINMDYRSLYLHFENGAFLYNCDAVKEMRKDFEHIFAESTEVTEKYKSGRSAVLRGTQCLLRLFAPLM